MVKACASSRAIESCARPDARLKACASSGAIEACARPDARLKARARPDHV
jgi:hypothetical protein